MTDDAKCYAATPAATLEQHITDSNVPKNDAEWWAYHEITRLRAELAAVKADCEHGYSLAEVRLAERDALREENARLREALEPFAYIAEHVGEEDARWAVPSAHLRAAAAAIREGGK